MSYLPSMYHNPVEWTGGIRVEHKVKETVPPERTPKAKVFQPFQPTPEPVFAYGWWCPKCDSFHEEVGECPYE